MTDAEFERRTNVDPILNAKGKALIAGLGIGLILAPFITRCDSVTVIEKEADVIALVASRFPSVTVIHADIFKWLPAKGAKFDTIYFDIWSDVCADDLDDDKALRKRFRKYLSKDGYMESWTRIANKYNRYLSGVSPAQNNTLVHEGGFSVSAELTSTGGLLRGERHLISGVTAGETAPIPSDLGLLLLAALPE